MSMYNLEDALLARRSLRKAALMLAAALAPMLASYVLALVKGAYAWSAALAAAMLAWCLFAGDLLLAPRARYARFLREMGRGLRRSVDCVPEAIGDQVQLQDGVFVRSVQVRLSDGDSRIYYLNASKMDCMAQIGQMVRLVSYGRHIVEFIEN